MKVGDLVRSSDPYWTGRGIIVEYHEERLGEDLNIREYKVQWYSTPLLSNRWSTSWAMENGITVISSAEENNCEDIKE